MSPGQQSPAVSVIIAAFNAEDTLGAQLQALSRQRCAEPFEILVCDNGSTDSTAALVHEATSWLPGLRLVDASARRGPAAARNIGAAHAHGRLLLFCDADDVVADGWVDALRDGLVQTDLVAGALEGRQLNRDHRAAVSWEVSSEITLPFWPRYGAGASSNLGVVASVFSAVGGFDEALRTGEDIDFCWRVQIAGCSFARCPAAVVHSRQRDGRRAVFDQAYSYGAGHRALRLKYRRLIAADASDAGAPPSRPAATSADPQPDTDSAAPNRSVVARVRRGLLTPTGHANVAWRLGEWLGARFGRISNDVTPLEQR